MTSPVMVEREENTKHIISFVMPEKYQMSNLPKPDNQKIKIQNMPGKKMAALSWKGNVPSPEELSQMESLLRKCLQG